MIFLFSYLMNAVASPTPWRESLIFDRAARQMRSSLKRVSVIVNLKPRA